MDFYGSLARLFSIYQKLARLPSQGFLLYTLKYETENSSAFFYAILQKPDSKIKSKEKLFEKAIDKSKKGNKLISPGDFAVIERYLLSNYQQLANSRDYILDLLRFIMAGLRLEFVPFHNLKFEFKEPNNPQIMVYEKSKGRFGLYINIVGLKENGLILAHERQIEFIKNEIKNGIDPMMIRDLPSLRTGNTYLDLSAKGHESSGIDHKVGTNVRKFRNLVQRKKDDVEIKKELDFATVIDSFDTAPNSQAPDSSQSSPIPSPPMPSTDSANQNGLFGKPFPKSNSGSKPAPLSSPNLPIALSIQPISEEDDQTRKAYSPQQLIEEISALKTQNTTIQSENQLLVRKIESLEHSNKVFQSQIDDLQEENNQYKQQLQLLTDNLTKQLQRKDEKLDNLEEIQKNYYALKAHLDQVLEENDGLKEKYSFAQRLNHDLEANLNEQKEVSMKESRKLDDTIELLLDEKKSLEQQLEMMEIELQKTFEKLAMNNPERIGELESQISELYDENDMLSTALKERDVKTKQFLDTLDDLAELDDDGFDEEVDQDDAETENHESIDDPVEEEDDFDEDDLMDELKNMEEE